MSVAGWIAVGVVAWVVVAFVVAVLIGRVIRLRDRQVPGDAPHRQAAPRRAATPEGSPRASHERAD